MAYTYFLFLILLAARYSQAACQSNQFECKDGKCIQDHLYCNDNFDCVDMSDEENCSVAIVCLEGLYRCDNGECVNADARCDGIQQCKDGSDENICAPLSSKNQSYFSTVLNAISTLDRGTSASPGDISVSFYTFYFSTAFRNVGQFIQITPASSLDHSMMYSDFISTSNFKSDIHSKSNMDGIVPSSTIMVSDYEASPVSTCPTSTEYGVVSRLYHLKNSIWSTAPSVGSSHDYLSSFNTSHHFVESKSTLTTSQIQIYSSKISFIPTKAATMTTKLPHDPHSIIKTSIGTSFFTFKPSVEKLSGISKSFTDDSRIFYTSKIYYATQSSIMALDMSTYILHPKDGNTPEEKNNKDKVIIPVIVGTLLLVVIVIGILAWRCRTRSKNNRSNNEDFELDNSTKTNF